jgi:methionyl-tRNA synthetase
VQNTFYITTPIYYPNDVPHIGHAYTTVATDVIARYHRLKGEDVLFLTGTDEHGLKLQRAAEVAGQDPKTWVDEMEPRWREVWQRLSISNDDYIRTTEPRHKAAVTRLLEEVRTNGRDDIYVGTYEGLYCVSCELYYTEDDLVDGNCPIHGTPVERMSEENYFFRLSAYTERLLEHYDRRPEAVQPDVRRNEVLSLIKGGLQDFSISRTSFDWGVPLPWDPKHITYVWFDALTNYITAAGYGSDEERFARYWPAIHMIGKDILRQHAVYWPAMLMAAGVDPPEVVFAHGFLLVGGEKMSKTKLTGIHPFELIDHFGVDAYRYYFTREVQFGQDGSFSWESMLARYNADLANGLGNLASRVLAMLGSYFDGAVPDAPADQGGRLATAGAVLADRFDAAVLGFDLTGAAAALDDFVREANKYLVEVAPWKLAGDPKRRGELAACLYEAAEALRLIALFASPIMPDAAARLWEQLGIAEPGRPGGAPGLAVGAPGGRDEDEPGRRAVPPARRIARRWKRCPNPSPSRSTTKPPRTSPPLVPPPRRWTPTATCSSWRRTRPRSWTGPTPRGLVDWCAWASTTTAAAGRWSWPRHFGASSPPRGCTPTPPRSSTGRPGRPSRSCCPIPWWWRWGRPAWTTTGSSLRPKTNSGSFEATSLCPGRRTSRWWSTCGRHGRTPWPSWMRRGPHG